MKLGLVVQSRRGVVAVRGYVGDGRAFNPTSKVVLDIPVLTPAEIDAIRLDQGDEARKKCEAFGAELQALFEKYEIPTWDCKVQSL